MAVTFATPSVDHERPEEVLQEKSITTHVEALPYDRTGSPEDPYYYDVDGLRVEGDGYDHTKFNPRTLAFIMTTLGCALALCGSQIVPLLYLTVVVGIAEEMNTPHLKIWMLSSLLIAQGAVAPFIGPLADLFGRKTIFLAGLLCNVMGAIVCATTPNSYGFIAGAVLMGFGTVIEELLAIAVVGESVPTSKRPIYGALILTAIVPWAPGTMYANWMFSVNWRWIGVTIAIWNFINLVIIGLFYWPPPRINGLGLSKKEKLARIDYVGGILLTTALIFILVGMNFGGQNYPWSSPHVITFLCLGFGLFAVLAVWEWKLVKYPMYPRRIIHAPRPFFCMMFVIFAAGINFIPLVVFWPVEAIAVFDADRFQVGLYSLPIGVCILGGAMLSAVLLGLFKRWVVVTMLVFCAAQTIASACLTIIDKNNINTAWASIVVALIGVGGVLVPNQVIITVITPDDLIASVTALTVGLRSQAQCIGLAIFYNQLVSSVTRQSYKYVVPVMFFDLQWINVTQIFGMMETLTAVPFKEYSQTIPRISTGENYTMVREATKTAFIHGFRHVYMITIAFGVAACIAAASMGSVNKYMDDHVAVVYDEVSPAGNMSQIFSHDVPDVPTQSRAWLERHDSALSHRHDSEPGHSEA